MAVPSRLPEVFEFSYLVNADSSSDRTAKQLLVTEKAFVVQMAYTPLALSSIALLSPSYGSLVSGQFVLRYVASPAAREAQLLHLEVNGALQVSPTHSSDENTPTEVTRMPPPQMDLPPKSDIVRTTNAEDIEPGSWFASVVPVHGNPDLSQFNPYLSQFNPEL